MGQPITYLDNNATTRVDPRVAAAMAPLLAEEYGNPSSLHRLGAQAAARVEEARQQVARLIGARDSEIIFTSGGTEADLTALRGVVAARPSRRHVVISAVEHHAVVEPAELLEREGYEVSRVRVDREGQLDLDHLRDSLRDDTALVSVILANNETGVIYPLKQVCELAQARGVLVHTDAVNALGKMPVDVEELGVDLLSLSAHKIHGPKGSGALYLRRGTPLRPLLIGGPQERHRRGGTLNAPGIVGLGAACAVLYESGAAMMAAVGRLRERLEDELRRRFSDVYICGAGAARVPNTTCACFPGISSEALVLLLSEAGLCVSSGAACSSGSQEPSPVLLAMGIPPEVAQGQVRVSLGRFNTEADVERLLAVLPDMLRKVGATRL